MKDTNYVVFVNEERVRQSHALKLSDSQNKKAVIARKQSNPYTIGCSEIVTLAPRSR